MSKALLVLCAEVFSYQSVTLHCLKSGRVIGIENSDEAIRSQTLVPPKSRSEEWDKSAFLCVYLKGNC